MSLNHEAAFAEEAQEETIVSESRQATQTSRGRKDKVRAETTEADNSNSETSPLLSSGDSVRQRQSYLRAGPSYQRAIDEPWTGAHRKGDLPWYKKPSVRIVNPLPLRRSHVFLLDIVAAARLLPLLYRIRRLDRSQDLSDTRPAVQRLPPRPSRQRPLLQIRPHSDR